MSLQRHDPPGFVQDLLEENRQGCGLMHTLRVAPSITPNFYDATRTQEEDPVERAKVTWLGFPRRVQLHYPNDRRRWEVADADRQTQDEYLEWSISRDADGKMTKIVFCNEGPEVIQPTTLLELYQNLHPGVDIKEDHLFENGVYNPKNRWNNATDTGTIMHLIQSDNTLGAQVDLAARATILRVREDGTLIVDQDELVRCSDFGNPDRNSDPTIGAAINNIARNGLKLTVDNPVGLYIESVDWAQIHPPPGHDDDDPQTFWTWTRGRSGYYVRGEFEVPSGKGYVLGDLLVRNRRLEFGGQLADLINVSIRARVSGPPNVVPGEPRRCGDHPRLPPSEVTEYQTLAETVDPWLKTCKHDRQHA